MHCFEIRTANVDFFVGEDSSQVAKHNSANFSINLTECCIQTDGAVGDPDYMKSWETVIRHAFMPVQSGAGIELPSQEGAGIGPAKETSPSGAYAVDKEGRERDISQAYQIFPDEVLGSGQFGIVYGGVHR